jgi:hypothetical protein
MYSPLGRYLFLCCQRCDCLNTLTSGTAAGQPISKEVNIVRSSTVACTLVYIKCHLQSMKSSLESNTHPIKLLTALKGFTIFHWPFLKAKQRSISTSNTVGKPSFCLNPLHDVLFPLSSWPTNKSLLQLSECTCDSAAVDHNGAIAHRHLHGSP